MARYNTYVFIDLGSHKPDKVTEFCMVAVNRQHLLDTPLDKLTPRVQNKLSWCFKVDSQKLQPIDSTDIGLEKENLQNITCFQLIQKFLNTIEAKPLCLIAYNANRDYPILWEYINSLNVQFSDDLMCADAHFLTILEKRNKLAAGASTSQNDDFTSENTLPMQLVNETTPTKRPNPDPFTNACVKKLRLDPEKKSDEDVSLPGDGLLQLYKQLLNKEPPEGSEAEVRVLCMLAIAVKLGGDFVETMDNEALPFGSYRQNAGILE